MDLNPLINPNVGKLLHKHNLLLALIKAELIENKIKDVIVKNDEISEEIEKIKSQNSIKNEEEFEKWKVAKGIKSEALEGQITKALKLRKYTQETFSNKAEARFLERQSDLDQVIYSLIRIKDPFKANELYFRIIENESKFETIATKFSEGIEKNTRGIIGPVSLSKSTPALTNVLRTSKKGEINKPVQIDGWTLIIRLEEMIKSSLNSATRNLMIQELFDMSINEEASIIMKKFLENSVKTS